MDCFTDDVLLYFTEKRQNLALGWAAGYSPSKPSISGIFLQFPNFLRSLSLSLIHSATREATRAFTLW